MSPSLRSSVRQKYKSACKLAAAASATGSLSLPQHMQACEAIASVLQFEGSIGHDAIGAHEWAALHRAAGQLMSTAERLASQQAQQQQAGAASGTAPHSCERPLLATAPRELIAAALPALPQRGVSRSTGGAAFAPPPLPAAAASSGSPTKPARLSAREKSILARSSTVDGRQYLPWCVEMDPGDAARFPAGWDPSGAGNASRLFHDPHGLMTLSPSQINRFKSWARIADIAQAAQPPCKPRIVAAAGISADRVRQQSVPDCSVIASLCIAAHYEGTRKMPLISGIIYPQDARGSPVYNPCGRYLVRLFFNGCFRRVEVDDRLPVDAQGQPLCAHSSDAGEFWPAILEKAYLKLCNGGYDFPGSNSAIDMHAFTGWLPERFDLKETAALEEGRVWHRLLSAMQSGDCLATVGTGEMSAAEEQRTGLVSGHAYAVLGVQELSGAAAAAAPGARNGQLQLTRLKNPWARTVWRGRYSPFDTASWTPPLRAAAGRGAEGDLQKQDDGTFFIDFAALCHAFSRLYLAWSPVLFRHRQALHAHWGAGDAGPVDDRYNIGLNPQFLLDVDAKARGKGYTCAVWVLLTRHVTCRDVEDESSAAVSRGSAVQQDSPFVSVQLHGEPSFREHYATIPGPDSITHAAQWLGRFRRVSFSAPATSATPYASNPHVLLRHDVPPGKHCFTLVVSQLKRMQDMDFTLRVWSMDHVSLRTPPCRLAARQQAQGMWPAELPPAGSAAHTAIARLVVPCACSIQLSLQAAAVDAIHFLLSKAAVDTSTSGGTSAGGTYESPPTQDAAASGCDASSNGCSDDTNTAAETQLGNQSQPAAALCSSGRWRKCFTTKTVLALPAGSYDLSLQVLGEATGGAPRPFTAAVEFLSDSTAAAFLAQGCALQIV
jgi:hypothetical protein